MNSTDEVAVTLTPELYQLLNRQAVELGVDLEWLVASLVVDTFEEAELPEAALV